MFANVSQETKKKLYEEYAQKVNRNKKVRTRLLSWLPMEFTNDTFDGGKITNKYKNAKIYN